MDIKPVFSIWHQADPSYHYNEINAGLKAAAAKLPRVDAIGGSSAGVIINNRPMIASLFRGIPKDQFHQVKNLFLSIRDEWRISVFLIEHDMRLVMGLSDSVYVIDYGEMIARGTPQEIRRNPEVIKAYLGEDVSA